MLGVVGGASPPRVVDDGIVVPQLQGPLSGVGLDELSLEAAKATPAGKKSSLRLACKTLASKSFWHRPDDLGTQALGLEVTRARPTAPLSELPRRPKRDARAKTKWFRLPVASLVCGVVPFGASFVELYFVLDSLWMEAYYYLFGFAACGFILLVLAAAEVASLLTYYTLCAENHRWWWRAFLAPATTGLYVFGYAAYYYGAHLQDEAFDVLQAGLFFGYMALVALGVALVAGAAGFLASLKFLAYIFAQIKFD